MIRIIKNTVNNCVFTLREKTTFNNANYILEMYSNENHSSKLMWLYSSANTSTNIVRYDLFEIEETTNEDINNLKVNLAVSQYDYFVWETSGSTLSLSALTTDNIVESGRINVENIDSYYTTPTFNNTNNEITFE
jgi:hypothetical protein